MRLTNFVRTERLELSQVALPDPKSGASAISPRPQMGSQIYGSHGECRRDACLESQATSVYRGYALAQLRARIYAEWELQTTM